MRKFVLSVLTGVLILSLGLVIPPSATALTVERSRAVDRDVTIDGVSGKLIVRTHYHDYGYFGRSVLKVCVKAKTDWGNSLTDGADLDLYFGNRWDAGTTRLTPKEFNTKDPTRWSCQRTLDYFRTKRFDPAWRFKGIATGHTCILGFCWGQATVSGSGRMS